MTHSARKARARPAAAPARKPKAPGIAWHAPADAAPLPGLDAAAWVVIAAAALALLWVAFRWHVIGDYYTESDFYGAYADGARLIQHGRPDPARYPVVGPGYDLALALVGFVARDLFTAARLISVASAVGTLILWRSLLRRRAGAGVALWAIALLAANPVFFRYGYSSTTDLLAIFLQAAALHALLGSNGRFAPLRAGAFAALATFTRYNSVYLVPAGLAIALWLEPGAGRPRRRSALLQLAGFAAVAGPWVAFSLARGSIPGASLFQNLGSFYMVGDMTRNSQDQFAAVAESLAAVRSLGRAASHHPFAPVLHALRNVPVHLARDARELLGLPVALACAAGFALALADGGWRRLLPVWIAGALLFATLAPVFYSDRYSMAIVPAYVTLAAAGIASRLFALRTRRGGFPLKWLVALVPLALSVRENVAVQRTTFENLPIEVLPAARALARSSPPGARVMSRKAQIGFYADRPVVPFPRLGGFAELGEYCREQQVSYLYYSWYEARLRPEFCYLIDTSSVVPGLTVVHTTDMNPSVLYRVGPELGRAPAWMAVGAERRRHLARAIVRVMPDSLAVASHLLLAAYALDDGDAAGALQHLDRAASGRPLNAAAWQIRGEALRQMDRLPEAIQAYRNVLALDPTMAAARFGMGWALLRNNQVEEAARAWRPVIGQSTNVQTLEQMIALYDRLGDREAAAAARTVLAALKHSGH